MPGSSDSPKLIRLDRVLPALQRPGLSELAPALESLLAIGRINEIHTATESEDCAGADYFRSCLEHLGVNFHVRETDLLRIPSTGPVVAVSNHPFGGIDAIILSELLTRLRPDARILGNSLLHHIPKTKPWVIPVDPFGGAEAARSNLGAMRDALTHLKRGGLLGTFPGGAVSHFHVSKGRVTDPEWSRHIAAIVRRSEATVVPVFFAGRNSFSFQVAGMFHPLVRTAMLARETVNKKGRTLHLHIGKPIPFSRLKDFDDDEQLARFLRISTYVLRGRASRTAKTLSRPRAAPSQEAVGPECPKETLAGEVSSLPADSLVFEQGEMAVHVAAAQRIPNLLMEIGRLREITFREVGEGTGKAFDLDEFDAHYLHLFLWNRNEQEIVGAYRFCRTDEVLGERGRAGLYTATLFKFKPGFIEDLGPALEMGRSFIVSKYQQKHSSLSLLWKGIGRYVVLHPQYKILFGPVSISQEYNKLSRNLLVQFMKNKLSHPVLAHFVKPSKRFRGFNLMGISRSEVSDSVRSIDDVSALISEIEADGKGIPILLKQYVRLNMLLLSFNVDKKFSNCLDGLMMADLTQSDPRILGRYLTPEGVQKVIDYHAQKDEREREALANVG